MRLRLDSLPRGREQRASARTVGWPTATGGKYLQNKETANVSPHSLKVSVRPSRVEVLTETRLGVFKIGACGSLFTGDCASALTAFLGESVPFGREFRSWRTRESKVWSTGSGLTRTL